jgi:hypothetical protein
MAWKPASIVLAGGTEAVKAFKGRKVRVRNAQPHWTYDPAGKLGKPVQIAAGTEGFVANPWNTSVLAVDWKAFRSGFDIEEWPARGRRPHMPPG